MSDLQKYKTRLAPVDLVEKYIRSVDRVLELEAACESVIEWWKREGMAKMNYGAPNCIFRVQDALVGKIK